MNTGESPMARSRLSVALLFATFLLTACASTEQGSADPAAVADQGSRTAVNKQKIASTDIAYYERGRGRPLLMLTGTASTMSEWDPALLSLLQRRHRLVLIDYPGIGRSGPAYGRLTFSGVADQVAHFIRARAFGRKVDVLGWSMGGFVAQRLVAEHSDLVRRQVLAGTNPGGVKAVLGPRWAQQIDSHATSDRQALKTLYPRTPWGQREGRRFLRRLIESSGSGEIPNDFRVRQETARRQVAAEDKWLRSNGNWRKLSSIQTPTLVTVGRRDPVTPATNARRIHHRLPHSKLRVLPGAHAFLFQSRRAFVRAVDRFAKD